MKKHLSKPSFLFFLTETGMEDIISLILKGHLVLDALFTKILELKKVSANKTFKQKIDKLNEINILNDDEFQAFSLVNDERNDLAHILGHRMNDEHVFKLLNKMASLGVEFTDELIFLDYQHFKTYYDIYDAFVEIFSNLYIILATKLADIGGEDFTCG